MVSFWSMMAMAPTVVSETEVSMVSVAPRLENPSALPPRISDRSMLSACLSSQIGRMDRSRARALMTVRPAITSAIRSSRDVLVCFSALLASAITAPERQAI